MGRFTVKQTNFHDSYYKIFDTVQNVFLDKEYGYFIQAQEACEALNIVDKLGLLKL